MKKIIAILSVLLLTLFGCSGGNNQTITECTYSGEGIEVFQEYTSKDNVILKLNSVMETEYDSDAAGDQGIDLIENQIEMLNKIDGLDYEYKLKDDTLIITLEIDYENGDHEEMLESGIILNSVEESTDLEFVVEQNEIEGATCSTK